MVLPAASPQLQNRNLKVISAIFLKDTLDAANNDAEQAVVERLQKKREYVARQVWRQGAGADDEHWQ